jgi:RNA polymerase sigma-70 factor, ECF subfamily
MATTPADAIREQVAALYRAESRRVLATLIRLLGDFDLAEEAMHEAFAAAVTRWPTDGVPANPRAWLISTARFKTIDQTRRASRFAAAMPDVTAALHPQADEWAEDDVVDDRLRLIFTCCHPALAPDAQLALTLREVCGLTTEQIAAGVLATPPALAQRIVRAKAKIRDARIPYSVPERPELPARLDVVLRVVYLVFNEGYSATAGESVTRPDLSAEAIRLARLLGELLPEAEVFGLLGLMLLHESRRAARSTADGDLVLLDEQDRTRWDQAMIREGCGWVERALRSHRFGPYTLQAAIAGVHATAARAAETNWAQIVSWYDVLQRVDASPVVTLNRAVAIAMRDTPDAGLALIDAMMTDGTLASYHLAHAARADLLRRLDRSVEARAAYRTALSLAQQAPERRFLARRLAALGGPLL